MWCLSKPNGTRRFFATEALADAAAQDDSSALVWFDPFDYERHNTAEHPTWLQLVTDEQRTLARAHLAGLLEQLRARWIDPWGPKPEGA